jgi:hypothetical protein
MLRKLIVVLFFPCVCTADFWSTNSQEFKLLQDMSLNTLSEVRLHENTSDIFLQYVGLKRSLNEKWSVGLWYKYVLQERDNESHRALVDATLREGIFSNRFRFEYNITDDALLYRNKTTVSVPVLILDRYVHPFVADEFFVNIDPIQQRKENRLWAGIGFKIKNAGFKVAYLWRDTKHYDMEAVCLSTAIKF